MRRALRSLVLGLVWAMVWPAYLVLLAQAARLGPWPRSLGVLISAVLHGLALGVLIQGVLKWLLRPEGWAERYLGIPGDVGRQLYGAGRLLVMAALVFLIPAYLLDSGEIAPEGRQITAPALSRFLILGFEIVVWWTCAWLLHRGSALMNWFTLGPSPPSEENASGSSQPSPPPASPASASDPSHGHAWMAWLSRHSRLIAWLILGLIAAIIVLDVRGFSFSARRLATGWAQSLVVLAFGWALHRALVQIVTQYSGRWVRPNRSWARALTSAVTIRTVTRSRGMEAVPRASLGSGSITDPGHPDDLAPRLRRLALYADIILIVPALAWVWDLDLALVRFLANQPLWNLSDQTPVTLGDLTRAAVTMLVGVAAWRYMSTLFALTVFRRMPDDPGVRFALVTLCRYAVLGLTTIIALGTIHLDMAKISVVVAALGVGLGFGLQEIVANFVSGIIMLLERPIRIGDVVTVGGTTGKVDCINIRATTIINGDNQSMIVPNRQFITGDLVNWTHKDRIIRVSIKVGVAYGTDPDQVVDLLLTAAHNDPDVLRNPVPSALLEGFGDSALQFVLHSFVPDPALVGRVRHRLCTAIQRRFDEANIGIPYPTHELHLCRVPDDLTRVLEQPRLAPHHGFGRVDHASPAPPPPHVPEIAPSVYHKQTAADAEEGVHRGVDE